MSFPLRSFFFFLLFWSTSHFGQAQGRVGNVRMRAVDQQSIEVLYDLRNSTPTDSIYVRLQRRNGKMLTPDPKSISGDLGMNRQDGRDRRIVWNLRRNGLLLREEVRAVVLLKQGGTLLSVDRSAPADEPTRPDSAASRLETPYRGPAWALLSLLAPGTGNIFVQTPKPKVGLRPLVTVAAYGLLIYGAGQQGDAEQAYADYARAGNEAAGEPFYQRANAAHQRYYVATRAAAAIWVADITLTLIRGVRNQQGNRPSVRPLSYQLNYQANTPVAVIRYTF